MVRAVFFVCLISFFTSLVRSQESDYTKSVRAFQENKLDSAGYYSHRAVQHYRSTGQMDSLVFTYVQQALVVWTQRGLDNAIRFMDTVVAVAEKLPERHVARVATFSRMGQLLTQQYAFDTAARYFRKAEEALAPSQAPNRHYVLLNNQLAVFYLSKDDYTSAERYAQRAYDMNLAVEGKDGRDMVMIWQTRYLISHYSDRFEQALRDGTEFQRVLQLHYPPNHPNIGVMHNSLAIICETLKRYDEALVHRQKAVNIHLAGYDPMGDSFSLASAYQNLGYLYTYIHEPFLAQEYLDKGIRLLMRTHGEDGLGMVHPWTGLARLKNSVGHVEAGNAFYEKAYAVQRQHAPDDPLGMAFVEGSLGDSYLDQQQYKRAIGYYQQALDRYRRLGVLHREVALHTQRGLAIALSSIGNFEQAITLQHEVLAGFRKLYPRGNVTVASMLLTLGRIHRDAGQLDNAFAYSDSVVVELTMGSDFPSTASGWFARMPFSYHTMEFASERVLVLSDLYTKSGDRGHLKALLDFVDGYSMFMAANLHAFRSQAALIDLANTNKAIYSAAIEACWVLAEEGVLAQYTHKAFGYAERSKALLLRLAANGLLVDGQHYGGIAVVDRDREFRQRINMLNLQYLNGSRSDSSLALLSATTERYRLFQDSLKNADNPLFSARFELEPPGVDVIRKSLLTNGETLVEYAVTDSSVFIFVVSRQAFHVRRVDRNVLEDVKRLRELHGLTAIAFREPAYRLYQSLIKPVESYFASKRLLIVPDAELYYLNFEVLIAHDRERGFSRMPYLIRTHNLSYLLSAASAMQLRTAYRPQRKSRMLLFAPVFTDAMKAVYRKSLAEQGLEDRDYLYLYRQPFALQAAKRIGNFFSHDLFVEQQAEERTFKRLAPEYRILHLGTHGEVNNQAPLQSRLFFAKAPAADSSNKDDGYLYAYEIYAMQLRAELAVLTACETGTGALRNGEGVMSLAHSFMHAGCPSVVMSLWKIDEKASTEIITAFYENLKKGEHKSAALRNAKLQLIHDGVERLSHPYYWAGLALIGDNAPVYRAAPWRYWWVAALVASAAIVLLVRWQINKKAKIS